MKKPTNIVVGHDGLVYRLADREYRLLKQVSGSILKRKLGDEVGKGLKYENAKSTMFWRIVEATVTRMSEYDY